MKEWLSISFFSISLFAKAQLFTISEDTLCRFTNVQINAIMLGQQSYRWKTSDGYSSSASTPSNINFKTPGLKSVIGEIVTKPNAVYADKIIIMNLENSASITDPLPDVYFKIKDSSGTTIYQSNIYDEFTIPDTIVGSIILQSDQTYSFEFWDLDLFDTDDFLGVMFISNPNGSQIYEFGKLKFSIHFQVAASKYTHSVPVLVADPNIIVEDNNHLYVEFQNAKHEASISNWTLNGTLVESIVGIKAFIPIQEGCYIAKYGYGAVCNFAETEPYCYMQSATSELIDYFYSLPTCIDKNSMVQIPNLGKDFTIAIYSSQGQQVFYDNHISELEFSEFIPGLYFLNIKTMQGISLSKKIIIF